MRDFYVVTLSKPGAAVSRYALYEMVKGDFVVVWHFPAVSAKAYPSADSKLLPCQVFYPKPAGEPDKFPAYHFAVKAVGYSRLEYLKDSLQTGLGVPVRLFALNGWAPCLH